MSATQPGPSPRDSSLADETVPAPPEMTARAIVAGCVIGLLLAIGNLYMGLKTGWTESGNVTAAILGFALVSAFRVRYTPLENNITQATAVSAAGMAATAGLLAPLPAMMLLGRPAHPAAILLWGLALATLGTLLAVPLRRRLIVTERLPFPTGIATAEVITTMHASSDAARGRARTLLGSAAVAALLTWFRDARPAWIPSVTAIPGTISGISFRSLTLGFSWSPVGLAIGIIVGPHIGVSMLAGSLLAWLVTAPLLVRQGIVAQAQYGALVRWLVWPAVAIIVAATLAALVSQIGRFARSIGDLAALTRARTSLDRDPRPSPSGRLLLALGIGSAALLCVVGRVAFGLHPGVTLAVLALSLLMTSVCARAAGETDLAPLGPISQLSQALFALLTPGQPAPNALAASVVVGPCAQSTHTLWSLGAGEHLKASPARQIYATLIGALVGLAVVVPSYVLLVGRYGVGSETLPVPGAAFTKAIAELVSGTRSAIPAYAAHAAAVAFVVGLLLTIFARRRFVPSAVAMAIGMVAPASLSIAVAAGGLLLAAMRSRWPAVVQRAGFAVAAGAIAGESLTGVLIIVLQTFGVLPS